MDMSNRTLAIFLVGAIVLSLAGTLVSLNKINELQQPTGLATTQTGLVNLSIYSATDISMPNTTIDFGVGVVNITESRCVYANISNNGSGENSYDCWVNSTVLEGETSPVGPTNTKFIIVNDGNVNVSITMDSAMDNYTNFIGNCSTEAHNWYMYAVNVNDSDTPLDTCPGTNLNSSWWNVSSDSNMNICHELNWDDDNDALQVVFNLSICKSNSPVGYRNDNLTFTAAAA